MVDDRRNSRLRGVRAINGSSDAGIRHFGRGQRILNVKVVGEMLWVRIRNQVGARSVRRSATLWIGKVIDITSENRLRVGPSSSHERLMVVVADGIGLSE